MIPFFLFFTSLLLLEAFLLDVRKCCDFGSIGSSLVFHVVVPVFGDLSTAVGTEVETCIMGMQGRETAGTNP